MPSLRKRIHLICFGLYLAATLAGISMEAITQLFSH